VALAADAVAAIALGADVYSNGIGDDYNYPKQTGGGSGGYSDDEATLKEYYENVRNDRTDVDKIAENTGLKPENINKVKEHLFENEHNLDRLKDYGIPPERGRYDEDQNIADAWERLKNGNYTSDDIRFLQHEIAERWFEEHVADSYDAAHEAAKKHFPFPWK
jgi:DNA polymerase sigma